MKKFYIFFLLLCFTFSSSQTLTWQGGADPEQTQSATLLFNRTGTPLSTTSIIYAHIGVTLNGQSWQNVIGTWGNNTLQPQLTLVSGNIFKLDLTPSIQQFFNVNAGAITKINIVLRSATGNLQTQDLELNVGSFQVNLSSPIEDSNTILASGANLQISASNTGGNASYVLSANGIVLETVSEVSSFSFNHTNITDNQEYQLTVTRGTTVFIKKFYVIINPDSITESMPEGLENGINYINDDPTKAILVLDAPLKDFVYVAGSFNNYQPSASYAMKRDAGSTKFWLELNDLVPNQIYTYQYWVGKENPITNSPSLVKTADPFSTLVLSPFDDEFIPNNSYPNLPPYPMGQQREVTVLQTAQTPYPWSEATLNFVKPAKEDLVFYEVLIRDFDANRNYQDLIDRFDYFKDLNINAIKLMPVMEFEGNESWGYNTSFHMALDKFYGTEDKLKEFIDLCHQNGIAVVLDLAINHAFGRNPLVRMWMNDPQNTGWGGPSAESPYFNTQPMHSYNVGSDFNHQQERTQYYTQRVVKHWIENFKIDGFRWDLTKGFTQNCPPGPNQESCTNAFQQDRVDLLKEYADFSWSLDPDHYVIFEHLGTDQEEKVWADYRISEGKGIMLWGIMTHNYGQLMRGFSASINRAGHLSRGFQDKRLIAYAESHDEERIMYSNLVAGNTAGHNARTLETALFRMQAMGAALFAIPGPKMIWHFSDLGMQNSIFTCTNGSVNTPNDATPGDCKLDTKPQPQWTNDWMNEPLRRQIYDTWSKLILLKTQEPVFKGNYSILPDAANNLRQRIYVWNDDLDPTTLKNVVLLANFSVTDQNFNPNFPYPGDWYDLMDNTILNVTNTSASIQVPAGGFKMYGNLPSPLSVQDAAQNAAVILAPNPASTTFSVNVAAQNVTIYTITGIKVKDFNGNFSPNTNFDIQELNSGLYLVKILGLNQENQLIKLIIK